MRGARNVAFDFVKFFIAWGISAGMDRLFFEKFVKTAFFRKVFSMAETVIISPLQRDVPFMAFFSWEKIIFYLLFIVFLLVASRFFLKVVLPAKSDWFEKIFGLILGCFKGTLYLFVMVLLMDSLIQSLNPETGKLLSKSVFIPYLYKYNILLDFFR